MASKSIPRDIERYCYQIGEMAGSSNQIMQTCIDWKSPPISPGGLFVSDGWLPIEMEGLKI